MIINYLEDPRPGSTASHSKSFREDDLRHFGEATDDFNPVHFDEAFARTTPFRGRVVHGMLTASLISAVLARYLPGPGCIYLSQLVRFEAPVRIGDTVIATVTLTDVDQAGNRIRAKTRCRVGDRIVVCGEAVFKARRRTARAGPAAPR